MKEDKLIEFFLVLMFPLDITQTINEQIGLYPGDPPFKQEFHLKLPQNEVNLSSISMGVHTGTHVDVPFHFFETGKKITDIPLSKFQGMSLVIEMVESPVGEGISSHHLEQYDIKPNDIILIKTKNSLFPSIVSEHKELFLTKNGAEFLIEKKIKAIGIDCLSIGDSNIHKLLLKKEIFIYESLDLHKIVPNRYLFFGFPLKLEGAEGAPVRAVLFQPLEDTSKVSLNL